jgi:hypothetical protein
MSALRYHGKSAYISQRAFARRFSALLRKNELGENSLGQERENRGEEFYFILQSSMDRGK